jgi:FtsX-like permease family
VIRIIRLAAAVNRRAKLKFLLLTALISTGTLVFLGVAELSRASTDTLSQAIEADLGAAGTYRIEPSSDLALPLSELLTTTRKSVGSLAVRQLVVAQQLPSVHPECPPFNQIGDVSAAVLLAEDGRPLPYTDAGGLGVDADLCLGGLVVPRTAIRETTESERKTLGASVVIDPVYAQSIRLTSTQAPRYTIVLTTGRDEDQTENIKSALNSAFTEAAQRASIVPDAAITVTRADAGTSVRAASDGIRLVYALIGWGVLLVGGLGILVTEMIVLRDRTWYFGLVRAVGARKRDVAGMVLADIVLVLLLGFSTAALVAVAVDHMVESFGRSAFGTDLSLLRLRFVPQLLLGAAAMLLLGGAYPAWRATRLDPLDVLERR